MAAALSGAPSTGMALARGEDVLASTEAVGAVILPNRRRGWARVAIGGVVHVAISLFWARVLERLLPRHAGRAQALAAGLGAGAGIALIDLGVIGRRLPTIRALDGFPLVADHLAYGAIVAWVVQRDRGRRRSGG